MSHLQSFLRNPLSFVKRAVYKMTVDRLRYGMKGDYDAELYWGDRFRKHGLSLAGPGHDGFSPAENEETYREAAMVFVALCEREKVDFGMSKVLEIGCATGYYAGIFRSRGVVDYLGIDITDALFSQLGEKFGKYQFLKLDVATENIPREKPFDVITLIDVAQHIVDKSKFQFALFNIDKSLAPKGRFIFTTDLAKSPSIHAFYETQWILSDFAESLPGYTFGEPRHFRDKYIVCASKR